MSKQESKEKLKPYHIILLSCLLASLMIWNSNHVNNQKELFKLNAHTDEIFSSIIRTRKLEDNENTKEVCSRASDDLNEYYKTGDLSKIDLDDKPIKCEDEDKSYIQTLIDLVKGLTGDEPDTSVSNQDSNENEGTNLRNLKGELDTNKLIEYIMRALPFLVFFAFSILAIFGWIICCICCCCDCCCCCCCKKEGNKCLIPCFIFTYIFYALVICVCVYGLTKSKKIFVGLANVECSILKFFGQVLDGESKQEKPRWAGINNINHLLDRLTVTITSLKTDSFSSLSDSIDDIEAKKAVFQTNMEDAGKSFFEADNINYKAVYSKDYREKDITGYPLEDTYVLDIVKMFGKKEDDNTYTENSTLYYWNQEFSIVADLADEYLHTAKEGFNDILNSSFNDVIQGLEDGSKNLDKITKPFTDADKKIGDILGNYAGYIDDYGKLSVTLVFTVLMVINAALGALMILIFLCSTRSCADCCFFRCIFKSCTHILWNILALMTILSFLIGSLLGLVGTIGGDAMSLVSYIMSEKNFNSTNPLILGKLKESKKYIQRCIHGDGDISKELNLGDSLNSFDDINNVEGNISIALENFTEIKRNCYTYNELMKKLEDEDKIDGNTILLPLQGQSNDRYLIQYDAILELINSGTSDDLKWCVTATNDLTCSNDLTSGEYYHPKKCQPINKLSGSSGDVKKYAEILKDIDDMVAYANNEGNTDSVKKVISTLKGQYETYLSGYTGALENFLSIIHRITDLVREYSGDGDAFAFLNGKFIGTNLKIILKYLKYSLGVDLYTVGLCLNIVGCSLVLSVSATILLIILINLDLKKNMDMKKLANTGVSEFQSNYPQIPVQPKF
jgi:hypothetical protein